MALLERIGEMLGGENTEIIRRNIDEITEIRLRTGQAVRLSLMDGREVEGETLDARTLHHILNHLMDNSLYSRENELRQGYFTAAEGFRVGVCGKINAGREGIEQLANIGSACIRIPREIRGCAAEIAEHARRINRFSVLIVSPPGLGKTTLLRDYIRILSDAGLNVGLADERREIACCLEGVPQLDVGRRTDVLDGCPKHLALSMLVRSCAPDLVAADEIGTNEDGQALLDARRCGVSVAVSVHGRSMEDIAGRSHVGTLLKERVFDWCVLLGPVRGRIGQILSLHKEADERLYDAQGNAAGCDPARLRLRGTNALQCAQAKMRKPE